MVVFMVAVPCIYLSWLKEYGKERGQCERPSRRRVHISQDRGKSSCYGVRGHQPYPEHKVSSVNPAKKQKKECKNREFLAKEDGLCSFPFMCTHDERDPSMKLRNRIIYMKR